MRLSSREITTDVTSPSGSFGIGTSLPDAVSIQPDHGAGIVVHGRHAIASVMRKPGENDIPVGRLDVFMLACCELVTFDTRELAVRIRQVVKPLATRGRIGGSILGGRLYEA